jgi:hypothetical protein
MYIDPTQYLSAALIGGPGCLSMIFAFSLFLFFSFSLFLCFSYFILLFFLFFSSFLFSFFFFFFFLFSSFFFFLFSSFFFLFFIFYLFILTSFFGSDRKHNAVRLLPKLRTHGIGFGGRFGVQWYKWGWLVYFY